MTIKISGFQVGAPSGIPQYGTVPTYNSIGLGSEQSGTGLVQVTYSAPAGSTSICFVSSDKSDSIGDGFIGGWTNIDQVNNNGAEWWEYLWVSASPNGSSMTNEIATSVGNLNGNWIGIIESINGMTSIDPPSPSNTFQVDGNDYGNTSICGFVVNDGDFMILFSGAEGHDYAGGNITSITSESGLVWTKKSSRSNNKSPSDSLTLYQTSDIWYTKNQTGNTITDVATVTFAGNFDDQSTLITTWTGVDLADPWV